nr:PIN domain-containing protein [Halovivax limisalsi]
MTSWLTRWPPCRMIVADTSALVSLSCGDVLVIWLDEFDVHTSRCVLDELESTAAYDDTHGRAAAAVTENVERVTVHDTTGTVVETSRIDRGEGTCVALCNALDASFLVTDDFRALPELERLTEARVAISPIVLSALVKRGRLRADEADRRLERIAEDRDWLGRPIYHRARTLLEDDRTEETE